MLVWHCPACITNQPDDVTQGPIMAMGALNVSFIQDFYLAFVQSWLKIPEYSTPHRSACITKFVTNRASSRSDISYGGVLNINFIHDICFLGFKIKHISPGASEHEPHKVPIVRASKFSHFLSKMWLSCCHGLWWVNYLAPLLEWTIVSELF